MLPFQKSILFLFAICCSLTLSAQSWQKLNDSPFIDDHTNGYGFEGKGYLFRGIPTNNGNGPANEVWEYDPIPDSWKLLTTFPGDSRSISIGDDWDGKYYYGFGIGGPDGLLNDLWVFDPVDTSFTQLPSCPCVGRSHPSLVAHNDKIYMGAGSSFGGDLNDWWEYDILTQEWLQKPNIPGAVRHHMFHFSSDKYIYVGGGHVNNWNRYDPDTEEWTPIDDLPEGRVAGTQFNYNGLGFILAGDDRFHVHVPNFQTFMYFSPETGEWDYLPQLPNGSRWAPSSFIIDSELYFFAGTSSIMNGDASVWKFDLRLVDCLPPSGLNAVDIDGTSAGIFWVSNSDHVSDTLKWRKIGDQDWNDVVGPDAVYQLDNLESCQDYEFKIVELCDEMASSSEVFNFRTDGCCLNPEITVSMVTPTSARIEWPDILAAEEYNIRWKEADATDWNMDVVSNGPYELIDLFECTRYEFQIESICSNDDIDYSESKLFSTSNCGACIDAVYCEVPTSFTSLLVFINKIGINDYVNESGNNSGYANFDGALAEDLIIGEPFTFVFEPGFDSGSFSFGLKAWIDFNGDANFEESELVVDETSVSEELSLELVVPNTATLGLTRMRIYYSNITDPCFPDDSFVIGEAEDYCLNIIGESTSVDDFANANSRLDVFPNPFQNKFLIKDELNSSDEYLLKIVDVNGKIVHKIDKFNLNNEVALPSEIPAGVYFLMLENDAQVFNKKIIKQD